MHGQDKARQERRGDSHGLTCQRSLGRVNLDAMKGEECTICFLHMKRKNVDLLTRRLGPLLQCVGIVEKVIGKIFSFTNTPRIVLRNWETKQG